MFVLVSLVRGASIRDVDFKNFAYPFPHRNFIPVPDKLLWMTLAGAKVVLLRDGRYTFACDADPSGCPTLTWDQVDFVHINRLPETSAIVTIGYHTGGTAQWQYLYVVGLRSGKPTVIAWLQTGSRAYKGLRKVSINRGDLVLIVNDPEKRVGDCCSTGSITYRYRWTKGSFYQIGAPIFADDPQ